MDVRLETIPPIRVVYFRGSGPYQTMMPPLWKRMNAYAQRRGLRKPQAWYLTIPRGNPRDTPPEQVQADACVSVDDAFVPDEDAAAQTILGGPYAIYRYVGPYQGLGQAWGRLADQWMSTSGHRPRPGLRFEVYRNDPSSVSPAELVTEIYVPVEPR